jgi:hypothetical protein
MQAVRDATAEDFGLTRREQLTGFLSGFAAYALLAESARAAPGVRTPPTRWIERQDEIARALAAGRMTPLAWMTEVERLAGETDVAELMATVRRGQITPAPAGSHNDPKKRWVRFVDAAGEPRRLAYGAALFDFAPHNVITPHGHRHMVSAHLVVAGRFRIRNFDRLRDEGQAMVIRPTRDYVAGIGALSAMSSARDNIHWFTPQGGPASTFDVVISGLDPGQDDYEIRAIDPLGGRRLKDGSILAPIIPFDRAAARYTAKV